MKQIPNLFTLLNLLFGCLAIVSILQNGIVSSVHQNGELLLMLPEKIYLASVFIGIAAVVDFLDGFVARLLKATSEMGKQLDSLADVVSFGVAPAMIVYQFLRLAYAQQEDGLNASTGWLLPAFLIPCAGAYRLARFNLDSEQSNGFKGVPIPAVGLLIASFPLIYWYSDASWLMALLLNQWFWFAVISITTYLMVSTLPMLALKFNDFTIKNNLPKIILLLVAIISAVFLGWLAVPLVFAVYIILSILMKDKSRESEHKKADPHLL
jgi:CDP-diacylglycerol--serine O-phosphatidyltransferase